MFENKINKFCVVLLFVCGFTGYAQYDHCLNYSSSLKDLVDTLEVDQNTLSIFVDKSDYKLSILSNTDTLKQYPVVFGGNPVDDKLREGDQCTPEGDFKVISKYPHRSWSKFIWINYPNDQSRRKHQEAKAEGVIPVNAAIGGEIGIHGVPAGFGSAIKDRINWTLGCISLENQDVNEIYAFVFKEMKVRIVQ